MAFEVVPNPDDLPEFLTKYWNMRLGENPCSTNIDGRATIGEQIPNYGFSYNDAVIARRSFTGLINDSCQNQNIVTRNELKIRVGDMVNIVIGSSVFVSNDTQGHSLITVSGTTTPHSQLVLYEMNAVNQGQVRVEINGEQQVGNIHNLRVGPMDFQLEVSRDSNVAERMEYPLERGQTYEASTGGHCMVVRMNQPGTYRVRVDFDGVRSFTNRVDVSLLVE